MVVVVLLLLVGMVLLLLVGMVMLVALTDKKYNDPSGRWLDFRMCFTGTQAV